MSVKAALRAPGGWVVLRNDRKQWELPGGRIDVTDSSLKDTVRRECLEELGVSVDVKELCGSWLFEVIPGRRVVIVCFAATAHIAMSDVVISDEHDRVRIATEPELDDLDLHIGYRRAVEIAKRYTG